MAEEAAPVANPDDEAPENAAVLARHWCNEIKQAEKAQKKWVERAQKIEKIYADERDLTTARQRKFNILYSNVETLRPAVYMQTPKAKAKRRYRDRDPVARLASMMLERCVQTSCELYDFDSAMDQAVRDRLLPGRGVLWVSYEASIYGEVLAYENATATYVPWQDFLHSVARTWDEVRWVARRFYKSRKELAKWLVESQLAEDEASAKKKAKQLQLDYTNEGKEKQDEGLDDDRGKAQIWEVHDKESGQVIYVAPGSNEYAIVGQREPAVKFKDFFPTPRPLLGTLTAKSLIPTPDYAQYQDQAEELNRITERIGVLQKALKVAGVYASESEELAQLVESGDNRMIPVKNWAMFAEGGGARGRIEWFPVENVAIVLEKLYLVREQAKQTLYEVSGIGDILRGSTDPDETATAQGIKAKWGSLRVRRVQKDVQRYAADIMRLKAEVISEMFQDRTIMQMAGVDQEVLDKYVPAPPPPEPPPQLQQAAQQNPAMAQQIQQAMQQQAQQQKMQAQQQFMAQVFELLRDDTARNFRIDVETDSTLEPDLMEEKQTAVEFVTAISGFMEKAAPLVAQGPEAAKVVGELMLFAVRRFDKVDQLEQTIEQAVEAAAKPRPPAPDPKMIEAEGKLKIEGAKLKMQGQAQQQEMGFKQQAHQMDMQHQVQKSQVDLALQQQEGEQKLALNEQAAAAKLAMMEGAPPQ